MANVSTRGEAVVRLKPGEEGQHFTFCRICEAFCGLTATVEDGRIKKLGPDPDSPHSQGYLCVKGPAMLEVTYDPDRLTRPMKRVGGSGEFVPVSWEEAMSDIASRLGAIITADGADAVADYIGNPTAFSISASTSIRPFLAHFGIWKIFCAATQDTTSRMVASYLLYGSAFRLAIPDLPRCDFLLILGANPLVSHGSILTAPLISQNLDDIHKRGRVVVVDPRRTETARRFDHIAIRPDSDVWLLAAMVRTVLREGLADESFLARSTSGFESLRTAVAPITPERAEQYCGIPAQRITELARSFATARAPVAYGRAGLCRGRFSTVANLLLDALNIVTGRFGRPGGWVFGDSPVDLAALRPTGFEMRQTRLGKMAYVSNYLPFGQLAEEILTPGPGRVRALLIQSGNVMLSAPGGERLREALQSLDLFVSMDLYVTETNRYADYILPGTTFLEREDLPLVAFPHSIRPYAQYTDAVIPAVGEARDDHDILNDLAARLHSTLVGSRAAGYMHAAPPGFNPIETIDRLLTAAQPRNLTNPDLSVEKLKALPHGVMLAEVLSCDNSTSKIIHKDGLIHLWSDLLEPEFDRMSLEAPPDIDELRLFGRRTIRSINSWMHNVDRLVRGEKPSLLMHPDDAAKRGIADGEQVIVRSRSGQIEVTACLSADVMPGSICYPHGWGHGGGWRRANEKAAVNVNILADPLAAETISGSAFLDGIPVTVVGVAPKFDNDGRSALRRRSLTI